MEVAGEAVLDAIQEALDERLAAASRIDEDLDRLDGQLDELVASRGATLLELARHYLPEISRDHIDQAFAGVRGDLENILARKRRQQRKLRDALAGLEAPRRRLGEELATVTQQLNETVARREALERQLAEQLPTDPEFARLCKRAVQVEQRLEKIEERVEQIRAEAAEKLPAYRESRLFQYLYGRGLGTPEYRARGLTRRLDRWVATLIDYPRARRSYDFLRVTPELAEAELARRREELGSLVAAVEAMEVAAAEACGLPKVLADGQRLGPERARILEELESTQERLEPVAQELSALEQSEGDFYEEAVRRFKEFLEQTQTAVLERRAAATPESADDEIVAEITWLNEHMDEAKSRIVELRALRREAERSARGLRHVVRGCRRSDLDSARCYFPDGFEPSGPLARFLEGETDAEQLLQTLQDQVRYRRSWAEETGEQLETLFEHPASQVLIQAVATAVGVALRGKIHRGPRIGGGWRPPGGFTRGRGF